MSARAAKFETTELKEMTDRASASAAAGEDGRAVPATPSVSDEEDSRDMGRLMAGQNAALNDLMNRHAERLFQYLVRSLENEDDAADLAQETFVRIYQNLAKFDERKKFSTWLYAIASNLVRDRYRWRKRHPKVSLDATNEATGNDFVESLAEESPLPSETVQVRERAAAVRRAVAALPDQLRIPLILSEYEEKSHAEIGEILRCSAKAVELRIYRARQQLRTALSELMQSL